jgi:DNA-binding GntR family transcriptional regulator
VRLHATHRVYEALKQELLDGTVKPGERIPDTEVCRRLGVSRTPVREALLALEREGLVRIVPRQGYFASEISLSDALDAYQLRFILEPIATAMAASRVGNDARIAELRGLAEDLSELRDATSDADLVKAIELNKRFHVRIAEMSGNARLGRILADLLDALGRMVLLELRQTHNVASWRTEHLQIVEALEANDPARAAAVVRNSFQRDEGMLLAMAREGFEGLFQPRDGASEVA